MLKNKKLKTKTEKNISLLLLSNLFRLTTPMNGLNLRICHSDTLVYLLVSEKKQEQLDVKLGGFIESINSRKSNNSFSLSLRIPGKN